VTLMVHVDHLNRPVRMTNSAKASVWDVIFTPWGAFHSATGAQTLNTRFPGQWFQLESADAGRTMVSARIRLALQLAPALRSDPGPVYSAGSVGVCRWPERVCVCGEFSV
jgi:hypothetical protein